MDAFADMEKVEEWLETLDYAAFWKETARFEPDYLASRESCDEQIASGLVDEKTVLYCLKGAVRLELVKRFRLHLRAAMPWHKLQ